MDETTATRASDPPAQDLLRALALLVVKQGVGLGTLSQGQRDLALALAWAGLPRRPMSEPEVNAALRARLAGAACCLDTDHVELRRWLVDAGWLQRDGFGREYRRVAAADVRVEQWGLAAALDALDSDAFVARARAEHAARRAQRRQAWDRRAGPAEQAA